MCAKVEYSFRSQFLFYLANLKENYFYTNLSYTCFTVYCVPEVLDLIWYSSMLIDCQSQMYMITKQKLQYNFLFLRS